MKMAQNQSVSLASITYFFTRSKDVHEENGTLFITLFTRLTIECTTGSGLKSSGKIESVWVNIEEVKVEHATKKMKEIPNCIYRYEVSKDVFLELYRASQVCPKELYYVTPIATVSKA